MRHIATFLLLALAACAELTTLNLREVRYASGASLPAERGVVLVALDPSIDVQVDRLTPGQMAEMGCAGAFGCSQFRSGYCRIGILDNVTTHYERILNHERMHCAGYRHSWVRTESGWLLDWNRAER